MTKGAIVSARGKFRLLFRISWQMEVDTIHPSKAKAMGPMAVIQAPVFPPEKRACSRAPEGAKTNPRIAIATRGMILIIVAAFWKYPPSFDERKLSANKTPIDIMPINTCISRVPGIPKRMQK